MKKNKFLIFILCVNFVFLKSTAQIVIDYQSWNPSSPPCNLFGTSTNVPATNNGSSTNIAHLTNIGQPQYSGVDNSVNLDCSYNGAGSYSGTQYQITNNFLAGYTYQIKINAREINRTNSSAAHASVVLNLNNGNGGNTFCTGTQTISSSTSGNLIVSNSISSSTFVDYTFTYQSVSSSFPYLTVAAVAAFSGQASNSQTIEIRKITITITGTPDFVFSPSSISPTCGSTSSQTYTVTNPYNYPNVTGYVWNLGANNGWNYNGSAAPSSFTTTSNSITLTPTCGSNLSNVAVTVQVNNTNYRTYTSTTSVTPPSSSSFSISGASSFCTSSSYTVANLTCGATVQWNVTAISGQYTTSISGNTLTVNRTTDGSATINATVTACGSTIQVTPITIQYGGNPITVTASQFDCDQVTFTSSGAGSGATYFWSSTNGTILYNGTSTTASTSINTINAVSTGNDFALVSTTNTCGQAVNASVIYSPYDRQIQGLYPEYMNNDQVSVYVNTTPYDTYYKWYVNNTLVREGSDASTYCTCYYEMPDRRVCDDNTIRVEVTISCGAITSSNDEHFDQINCNGHIFNFKRRALFYTEFEDKITKISVFPNPVKNSFTITIPSDSIDIPHTTIRITDVLGRTIKTITAVSETNTIPVSTWATGTYMVTVTDGKKRFIKKVMKE